jgi:hypothetical protein
MDEHVVSITQIYDMDTNRYFRFTLLTYYYHVHCEYWIRKEVVNPTTFAVESTGMIEV